MISSSSLLPIVDPVVKDVDANSLSCSKPIDAAHVTGKSTPPVAAFKVPRVPSLDASDLSTPRPISNIRKRGREVKNSTDDEVAHITSKIRRKIHTIMRPLSPLPASPVFIQSSKDVSDVNDVPAHPGKHVIN